ncbi:MAG: hypothetical protein II208_02935 [Alphaproteobacteria bacterium]|nr:hypothetical protein [Alphaproteobacteria bacterium]
MSMYTYVIKTPFSQMMADWREYRELCAKRDRLVNERNFRHSQVGKDFEGSDVKCMAKDYTGRKIGFVSEYNMCYCKNFFEKECDKNCPRWFQHDRYWRMSDELKAVRIRLGDFWTQKFQNVK